MAVGQLAAVVINVLQLMIIIQVVMTWFGGGLPLNRLTRLLYAITEALYRPLRAFIPTTMGGLDLAPLAALAILYLVDRVLVSSIIQLGYRLAG